MYQKNDSQIFRAMDTLRWGMDPVNRSKHIGEMPTTEVLQELLRLHEGELLARKLRG